MFQVPIVYLKIVAVQKLVFEFVAGSVYSTRSRFRSLAIRMGS